MGKTMRAALSAAGLTVEDFIVWGVACGLVGCLAAAVGTMAAGMVDGGSVTRQLVTAGTAGVVGYVGAGIVARKLGAHIARRRNH